MRFKGEVTARFGETVLGPYGLDAKSVAELRTNLAKAGEFDRIMNTSNRNLRAISLVTAGTVEPDNDDAEVRQMDAEIAQVLGFEPTPDNLRDRFFEAMSDPETSKRFAELSERQRARRSEIGMQQLRSRAPRCWIPTIESFARKTK
jgi:hypothetical protein